MSRDVPLSLVQPHKERKGNKFKLSGNFQKLLPFTLPFAEQYQRLVKERGKGGRRIWVAQGEGNDCKERKES